MDEVKIKKVTEWRYPPRVTVVLQREEKAEDFRLELLPSTTLPLLQEMGGGKGQKCCIYRLLLKTASALGASLWGVQLVIDEGPSPKAYLVLLKGEEAFCVQGDCAELLAFAHHCSLPIFIDERLDGFLGEEIEGARKPSLKMEVPPVFYRAFGGQNTDG